MDEVRHAARSLVKSPVFTGVAILTLALGIGATTAVFSVVNAVLLRPLPFPDADRLVAVHSTNPAQGWPWFPVGPGDFRDWRERNTVFEQMAVYKPRSLNLTGLDGEPERLSGAAVSASLFPLLRTMPALGRGFSEDEDAPGAPRAVVLGHGLWQRRLGGDPRVIGRVLTLNDTPHTVVGVLPRGFVLFDPGVELWVPGALGSDPAARGPRSMRAVARLRPGVSLEQAQAQMTEIARQLERELPEWAAGWGAGVLSLKEQVTGRVGKSLFLLLGAVAFVLLMACGNVAHLLLARAAAREKEVALRSALGANAMRLVRQLLVESLLLGAAAAAAGLLLASWGVDLLRALHPRGLPRLHEVRIDAAVLAFTALVSVLTSLIVGLVPAFQSLRVDLSHALKAGGSLGGGSRSSRVRRVLVVGQVAMSLVVLAGAGLMIRSFLRLQAVDPGFQPDSVLAVSVSLPESRYGASPRAVAFYGDLLRSIERLPGVEAAGATHALPLGNMESVRPFWIGGRPAPEQGKDDTAGYRIVTADYRRALGLRLLRGRDFTEADAGPAPGVVLINESMARRFWAGEDPVGARITLGGWPDAWGEVIGVVSDVRHSGLAAEPQPEMFWLYSQDWLQRGPTLLTLRRSMTLVVRSRVEPTAIAAAVKAAVKTADPDLPVFDVRPMADLVAASMAPLRFNTTLLVVLAIVGVVLAATGLYGLMAHAVGLRTREIGVRIALGAGRRDVLGLVVREGVRLAVIGVVIGLAAAAALTRLMSSLLFAVTPGDPLTFGVVSLLLLAVATAASYSPARRATNVDPLTALRYE